MWRNSVHVLHEPTLNKIVHVCDSHNTHSTQFGEMLSEQSVGVVCLQSHKSSLNGFRRRKIDAQAIHHQPTVFSALFSFGTVEHSCWFDCMETDIALEFGCHLRKWILEFKVADVYEHWTVVTSQRELNRRKIIEFFN